MEKMRKYKDYADYCNLVKIRPLFRIKGREDYETALMLWKDLFYSRKRSMMSYGQFEYLAFRF